MTETTAETTLSRLEAWSKKVADLQLSTPDRLQDLDRAIAEARLGRLHEPPPVLLTVLLLGATGGGKSELLNALAGERIAKSHYIRPTTSRPTIYAHADVTKARLYEYGATLAEVAAQPGAFITHQRDGLRDKVLIDAPDIDSYRTEHRELVLQLLPSIDVVLYVVTPFSYKDDVGWRTVLEQRGRRAFAFVLNKWDPEGRPRISGGGIDIDEDFRGLIKHSGYPDPRIFRTSAKGWVAVRADGSTDLPDDDLPDLEEWLTSGLASNAVQEIHSRKRRALWGRLAAALDTIIWAPGNIVRAGEAVRTQFLLLQDEGTRLSLPFWFCHGQFIAREHDLNRRPVSPGLIGFILRILNHGRLFTRKQMRSGVLLENCATSEPERWSSSALAGQLRSLSERCFANTEWQLRQAGVPIGNLEQHWKAATEQVYDISRASIDAELAAARTRAPRIWRKWAGILLLAACEAGALAVLGIAAWRVATGFFEGVYAGLPVMLNLAALILFIVLIAGGGMALLFPETQHRVARELESAFRKFWKEQVISLRTHAQEHLEEVQRLAEQGNQLQQSSLQQASETLVPTSRTVQEDEVERLFAAGSHTAGFPRPADLV